MKTGRRILALAWGALAAACALAQPAARGPAAAAPPPAAPAPSAAPAGGELRELNLTQLGVDYAVRLVGTSAAVGIPFSVRADEVVTGATLRLRYAYSPALLPELSHIKVSVNDVVVATLPVVAAQGGTPQSADIAIDRRLITEFNRINIELVGHYTRDCEDPAHSSLWATVDAGSTLRLALAPLTLADELATLPAPFFDRRDVRRADIPFAFAQPPSPSVLEAAGVLASWFGALAGYRGATFPVVQGEVPPGNAVAFLLPGDTLEGVAVPEITGPAVAVVPHPRERARKLLLVMGRDAAQLHTAAAALALNSRALRGAGSQIGAFELPAPRRPYDAPGWIASDRPVALGELAPAENFSVSGYAPDVIRVNLQLPPDLFDWRTRGIPLDLRYRYTPRLRPDQSTLNVNVDQNFIASLPLRAANASPDRWWNPWAVPLMDDGTAAQHKTLWLPMLAMGSRSQLRLHYYFQPAVQKCERLLDNVRGAVDPASTLDVSRLPHYIAMPDLAAYANSGFPFSRLADLAETAVVLPERPTRTELQTYLGLLGQIGHATAYPALRVRVARPAEASQWAERDLLVIGSLQSQPLFGQWAGRMPLQARGAAEQMRTPGWLDEAMNFVLGTRVREDLPSAAQITLRNDGRDAVLAGFESPLGARRSVVAVVVDEASAAPLVDALLKPELLKRVQGTMAVIRDNQVHSLLGPGTYYVGELPPFTRLQWLLSRSPLPVALMALAVSLIGAAVAYAGLQLRARRRLASGQSHP